MEEKGKDPEIWGQRGTSRDQELVATQGHGTRAGDQGALRALSQCEAMGLGGWGLPGG